MITDKTLSPYNERNSLITVPELQKMFSKYELDIVPKNLDVYIQALTHKSYTFSEYDAKNVEEWKKMMPKQTMELRNEHNERLEFLGDSIIKCVVSRYLYLRYYEEDEGFLTKLKTKIENRKNLARFAKKLGLGKYVIIAKQLEYSCSRDSDKLLEDCFESLMGALYLDQGFEAVDQLMIVLLETEVDYAELLYRDTNFKDKLLRFFHQQQWSHPLYVDVDSKQQGSKWTFTVSVKKDSGEIVSTASETSKKRAEQKAAMLALLKYDQLRPDQIVSDFD